MTFTWKPNADGIAWKLIENATGETLGDVSGYDGCWEGRDWVNGLSFPGCQSRGQAERKVQQSVRGHFQKILQAVGREGCSVITLSDDFAPSDILEAMDVGIIKRIHGVSHWVQLTDIGERMLSGGGE